VYQDTIHRYDYEIADELVDALVSLLEKFPALSLDLQEDIIDFMLQKVLQTAIGANAKVVNSLIPASPRKLKKVKEVGGTFLYRYQDMIKSDRWFHENGFCLDAIRQDISMIPNAGRGAFATRDIKKGETITVSPMLHIADREMLDMYPIITVHDEVSDQMINDYDDTNGPIGQQLIMNYAFGHSESSMLLVPVGPQAMLLNHGKDSANAYVTWSRKRNDVIQMNKLYLDYSVEQMAAVTDVVVVMKVVALRDIKEGEEITLDYGDSWQKAWEEYESDWKTHLEGKDHPLKAEDMRAMYKEKPFETVYTLVDNPYPENVHLACFLETKSRPSGTLMTHQKHGWEITDFEDPVNEDSIDGNFFFKVVVLGREEAPGFFFNYTVRARIGTGDKDIEDVLNVPHASCTFVDKPYTSDIHLPRSFRHYIGILDTQFPSNWRDLR
jgi:hypothetical protein